MAEIGRRRLAGCYGIASQGGSAWGKAFSAVWAEKSVSAPKHISGLTAENNAKDVLKNGKTL